MSTKAIPSFGALTPIESMAKGGSASDLFNPANIMGDSTLALQKPSAFLTNPLKGDGKTNTGRQEEVDIKSANSKNSQDNKWLNWTPSRSTGLKV